MWKKVRCNGGPSITLPLAADIRPYILQHSSIQFQILQWGSLMSLEDVSIRSSVALGS